MAIVIGGDRRPTRFNLRLGLDRRRYLNVDLARIEGIGRAALVNELKSARNPYIWDIPTPGGLPKDSKKRSEKRTRKRQSVSKTVCKNDQRVEIRSKNRMI